MPNNKTVKPAIIEEVKEVEQSKPKITEEKPKRTRVMTPEALEKLKKARELALRSKKEKKQIDEELGIAKKETFSEKIDQVETYRKLKSKVEDEVKVNELSSINKRLTDMYSKFDGFLQDREHRKIEKAQKKQEKQAREIVAELPRHLSQRMLEEEVKRQELQKFRERMFGVRII